MELLADVSLLPGEERIIGEYTALHQSLGAAGGAQRVCKCVRAVHHQSEGQPARCQEFGHIFLLNSM